MQKGVVGDTIHIVGMRAFYYCLVYIAAVAWAAWAIFGMSLGSDRLNIVDELSNCSNSIWLKASFLRAPLK